MLFAAPSKSGSHLDVDFFSQDEESEKFMGVLFFPS